MSILAHPPTLRGALVAVFAAMLPARDVQAQRAGGPPAGIWSSPRATSAGTPEYDYLALYPDGRALWTEPAEGLAGTAPNPNDGYWRQRWSRYEVAGRQLRFTSLENPAWQAVGAWSGDRIAFEKSLRSSYAESYRFVPSLAGPIEGLYKPAPDWMGIRFSLDGTFADEGFRTHLGMYSDAAGTMHDTPSSSRAEVAARRGGRGRYTIRDYTLELRYDDGRVVRHTILTSPSQANARPLPEFVINGQHYRRQ